MWGPIQKQLRIARDVEGGNVHCPVRLEMLDARTCEPCQFRSQTSFDGSGAVTGMVCTPTVGAMMKES